MRRQQPLRELVAGKAARASFCPPTIDGAIAFSTTQYDGVVTVPAADDVASAVADAVDAAAASALLPSGGVDGSPKASSFSCLRWKAIAAASSDADMEVFASWRA